MIALNHEQVSHELRVSDPKRFSKLLEAAATYDGPCKLGILGGTFDPIHLGHLLCAELARDTLSLDGVLFVPVGMSPFKTDRETASAQDRLAMCRLAIADNPSFFVSSIELDKGGVSYTVDTLRCLKDALPANVELTFIVGLDALLSLPAWVHPEVLAELARFCCINRPGSHFDERVVADLRARGFDISIIDDLDIDISSSAIRNRIRQGKSVRYMCPLSVCEYIKSKGLYRNDG